MHHISSQIVGDNPKGSIALSGGQVNSCQILGLTFAPIHNHMQNLMHIVQKHLLSIEPQLVAAIPPPAKRVLIQFKLNLFTYEHGVKFRPKEM